MSWRGPKPPHARPPAPEGFVVPCQPTLVAEPPSGPDWWHELKFDGYRILARVDAGRVRLWSRNGLNWTARLPRIVRAMESLPLVSVVLDGEAIAEDELGRSHFHGLRRGEGLEAALLVAWDVLEVDGEDLRGLRLDERRVRLDQVLADPPDGLIKSEVFDDGPALFRQACAIGLEGVVSKRRDCPYRSGRSTTWLKTKCPEYSRTP